MFLSRQEADPVYVSRLDTGNPLSTVSAHAFHLDGADWPTLEHYYQGMKFEDPAQREAIRASATPERARELAQGRPKAVRKDWKTIRETVMTRGVYIKARTHAEVAKALLMSDGHRLVENAQFDYYWGCGRDGRGHNTYGKVLMAVREKLKTGQAG